MFRYSVLILAALVAFAPMAIAQEEEKKIDTLEVGDEAPDFDLPGAEDAPEDAPKKLSDFEGKKNVVLAFYPKAKTSGCTKQLCGYRDAIDEFKSRDTEVVAISIDEQDYSDEFKEEQSYQFYVLGDTEGEVVKSYGIPVKEYSGTPIAQRSIMVVDKKGIIRYVNMKYNIGKDQEPLLEALSKIQGDD